MAQNVTHGFFKNRRQCGLLTLWLEISGEPIFRNHSWGDGIRKFWGRGWCLGRNSSSDIPRSGAAEHSLYSCWASSGPINRLGSPLPCPTAIRPRPRQATHRGVPNRAVCSASALQSPSCTPLPVPLNHQRPPTRDCYLKVEDQGGGGVSWCRPLPCGAQNKPLPTS